MLMVGDAEPLVLSGVFDVANAHDLERAIQRHAAGTNADVVIDCGPLEFIDSSAVGILLYVRRNLSADDRALRLINLPPHINRALQAMAVLDFLV